MGEKAFIFGSVFGQKCADFRSFFVLSGSIFLRKTGSNMRNFGSKTGEKTGGFGAKTEVDLAPCFGSSNFTSFSDTVLACRTNGLKPVEATSFSDRVWKPCRKKGRF